MTLLQPIPTRVPSVWDAHDLDQVDALMGALATGDRLDRIGPMVHEHLETGGKRLRARLALAAAEAFGLPRQVAVPWAAACELLHNATLVHDDVQDGDRLRRGEPTVWVRHGVPQAINVGDLMLMLPYRAIEHADVDDAVKWRLSRALARGAEEVVRGQAAEMTLLTARRFEQGAYEHAVRGKTAALFQLPVEGAALLAGWSAAEAREVAEAAGDLGLAFQIQDDIVDLYGDKGRAHPGSDLEEGKVSALVVAHLALHPADADALVALLETPREDTPRSEVVGAIRMFREEGALASVWTRLDAIERNLVDAPVLARVPTLQLVLHNLFDLCMKPIERTRP